MDIKVAVIGAGVVGSSVALELSRRGCEVALLEAEAEPGLGASGTNSGVVHTGFDSKPGELETRLILRAAELRDPLIRALGVRVWRCGAVMRPQNPAEVEAVRSLAENARSNGVAAVLGPDGALEVPGEAVTDPVAFTLSLAQLAAAEGALVMTDSGVESIEPGPEGLKLVIAGGRELECGFAVNCAGLSAGRVARMAGDDSFEVFPRKGEFLVFEQDPEDPLEQILLPVPSERTKGVLVFPTLDGHVAVGPTAVDGTDPADWSVRPEARTELAAKAATAHPPLAGREPVGAYAGLRPAGRGVNYVIGPSAASPRLVNVAAIRSTGLTASVGIADHVAGILDELGVPLSRPRPLRPAPAPVKTSGAWWRRTADYLAQPETAG